MDKPENILQRVDVEIDSKTFEAFAAFDIFTRLKRWQPLALFAAIMCTSAIICFIMKDRAQNAVLLGAVLAVIGLGLPIAYMQHFSTTIKKQSKMMELSEPKKVYTLTFTDSEIAVAAINGKTEAYKWNTLYGAYRNKNATYLYVESTRAYILPDSCVSQGPDALWSTFKTHMDAGKLHNSQR